MVVRVELVPIRPAAMIIITRHNNSVICTPGATITMRLRMAANDGSRKQRQTSCLIVIAAAPPFCRWANCGPSQAEAAPRRALWQLSRCPRRCRPASPWPRLGFDAPGARVWVLSAQGSGRGCSTRPCRAAARLLPRHHAHQRGGDGWRPQRKAQGDALNGNPWRSRHRVRIVGRRIRSLRIQTAVIFWHRTRRGSGLLGWPSAAGVAAPTSGTAVLHRRPARILGGL